MARPGTSESTWCSCGEAAEKPAPSRLQLTTGPTAAPPSSSADRRRLLLLLPGGLRLGRRGAAFSSSTRVTTAAPGAPPGADARACGATRGFVEPSARRHSPVRRCAAAAMSCAARRFPMRRPSLMVSVKRCGVET